MPPRTRRLRLTRHSVTAVVVSHDGAAWLPECLDALARQTRPPQRVVAVDTGSSDTSVQLLTDALGDAAVVTRPRDTGLGAAVQAGLEAFAGAATPPDVDADAVEWLWLLHDDCAPDDDALEQLLERAEQSPSASVLGPKVLSWDRRVLAEVGVTVDSSGQRETGLEPRELDQGQHDDVDDVLAVGTAGMLVRRETWDALGGLDASWPLAGDDVDFGWRVNASGGRVLVATRAVVRHAAALATGHRRADAVRTSYGAAMRGHGMQVVLANTSRWLVLPLALRLVVESVLRAVFALLLLRAPRRARDALVGLGALVAGLPRLLVARRSRNRRRQRAHRQIRGLLAPPGWRLRRAGDAVASVFAGRNAVGERRRRRAPVETGPVAAEAESFAVDDLGVLSRLVTRPGVLLVVALTVIALVTDRHLLGGTVHGGRLLPAPAGASDLWSAYTSTWHPVDLGSTTPAPQVLALLALLSTVLLGKVWLAVDVLMLGAVPLAGWSAYVAAGAVTRRKLLRVWAAAAYALVPALTGAVAGGRIDVVIATVLLPLAVRATAAAAAPAGTGRGLHRAFGAGLLLALVTAALPAAWAVAVATLVICLVVVRGAIGRRALASLVVVAVPAAVLLPLTAHVLSSPAALVSGVGLPDTSASRAGEQVSNLLLLHPGGPAVPPSWVLAAVVLAALVGLATPRRAARVGVTLFVTAVAGALLVSRLTPAGVVAHSRYWTGGLLAVAAAGAIAAATVTFDAAPELLRRTAFGWRQAGTAILAAAALAGTVTTAVSWLVRGSDRPLTDASAQLLPVFAQAQAAAPTSTRTLVLRASDDVVHYALLRSADGLRLGDADVTPDRDKYPAARHALSTAVADAAAGRARAAGELAAFGISLVVVPAGSEHQLDGLAAVTGLARVPATSTVVYRAVLPAGELVLLRGGDATAAASGTALAATARPQPLPAGSGHARESVPPASGNRLLVLAEPASSSWRATVDGHRLPSGTAYGWAQAWTMPTTGGVVVVARHDDRRGALLVAQLVFVVVALALSVPVRGVER